MAVVDLLILVSEVKGEGYLANLISASMELREVRDWRSARSVFGVFFSAIEYK